jgi:hemerythrin-like domain-containing protein
MRVRRILSDEQDLVTRFLAVLGRGLIAAGRGKNARPGFFIFASNFIRDYLEAEYFKKEEVLLRALEDAGFPADEGPVGSMRLEHAKSSEISTILFDAAKAWQAGDEAGRAEVVWATSEYTGLLRHHLERLANLIYPLLEQTVTAQDEEKIAEALNLVEFADRETESPEKLAKILQMLEEEVSDWER